MKQIYLLDDVEDIKKMLTKIAWWHPKAKVKIVTELSEAMAVEQDGVVVVGRIGVRG